VLLIAAQFMTSVRASEPGPRKIHFISLGCPKNRVDTEVMVGVALNGQAGDFVLTNDAEEAEVIVVNTCGFIGEANQFFDLFNIHRKV